MKKRLFVEARGQPNNQYEQRSAGHGRRTSISISFSQSRESMNPLKRFMEKARFISPIHGHVSIHESPIHGPIHGELPMLHHERFVNRKL